jgi:RNA polymerase sigma factor (sigma-70 family)
MTTPIDDRRCELLIKRSLAGDSAACGELVEYLWPFWLEMVQSNRAMRRLVNLEDGVHDVVVRLVEKLSQAEGRGFHSYLSWKERNGDKAFQDWLRIVTKNMIRDYLREQLGPQTSAGEPSIKRLLNEFASAPVLEGLGIRPPVTLTQTARELLEFAGKRLKPIQLDVLSAWLKGASFEEIALELAVTQETARQDLRSAIAVLRRYFAGSDEPT